MHFDFEASREERRRRFLRNLPWLLPVFLVLGAGLFIGVGNLVVWLWRVTVVDLFAFKAISFWQAWGLILLSQILFKANVRPTMRTGHWRGRRGWGEPRAMGPEPPPAGREV